jgi:hypothetical protein
VDNEARIHSAMNGQEYRWRKNAESLAIMILTERLRTTEQINRPI